MCGMMEKMGSDASGIPYAPVHPAALAGLKDEF